MVTVAQFIDSIDRLKDDSKAALKRHVQKEEFGATLEDECDKVFKQTLWENLPATFNALERTAVKLAAKPGDQSHLKAVLFYCELSALTVYCQRACSCAALRITTQHRCAQAQCSKTHCKLITGY